jgi:hypothetical protein
MVCTALDAATFITAASLPARVQVFADQKAAIVDYSKSDMEPHKKCEELSQFKAKQLAQISTVMHPADPGLPAFKPNIF